MIPSGKKIYLCTPDLRPITVLNGVKTESVNYDTHLKDYDVLTFEVDRYILVDGEQIESNGYELLDVYLNLYLEDIGNFQMQYPVVNNDGKKETKSITAYSLEKEFENKDWKGFKVNTGEKDSLEQLAENNLNDLGYAKEFIEFYKPTKKDLSLIHLILTKMPGWSVVDDDIDPLLWNKKISISEDNINLYALLTSIIAPKIECIFLFDTIHKRIKAIAKDRLNDYIFDTNIFIGYRNLANTIDINVNEDTVYTRFECRGDNDLTVNDYNYNDSKIFDLSYFLREPYMTDVLAEKIKIWVKWRDDNRDIFANLSKQIADINDKIYEIQYRLPNDGDNWEQWDDMEKDLLDKNLKYYNALLTSLQVSVDENPQYDSDGNYIPWKKSDGTIDHDTYLNLLYNLANGYGGYYTYYEVLNYIIPNIEIAIENLGVPKEYKKDYVKEFETNWELYGIEELTAKKKDYENRLDVLKDYAKDWSDMTEEEQSKYTSQDSYNAWGHSEYVEISTYLGSEETEGSLLFYLKKLSDEKSELETQFDIINTNRLQMVEQAQFTHESYGFTDNEIVLINTLFYDTDYTNSNILTTSLDTTITNIDREKELYEDSASKLSEVCEPQMSFSTNMDNLLHLPEFENWVGDFKLLNFIRLGVRDDYSVKLRLIGYSYNPCEITPDLTVEFSNMITSRSGRSDLTDILNNENNRASKNSISIGTGDSDSDKEYMTALLQSMIKTGIFKNAVGSIAGGISVKLDESQIESLVSKYIKTERIDADQINVDQGSFNRVFSQYIDSDYLVSRFANLNEAQIKDLFAENAFTKELKSLSTTTAKAVINSAYIKDIVSESITLGDLKAGDILLSNQMRILSENGNLVMDGSTLQITGTDSGGNSYVAIQLGYNSKNKPSLILRDETGALLLTPKGITENAIADGLIKNDMVAKGTLSKDKLSFPIIEPNEYGGVDITQIYDGQGNKFGFEYTSFKNNVTDQLSSLDKKIENSASYSLYIEMPNGNKMRPEGLQMIIHLFKDSVEVTEEWDDSFFIWTRHSSDSYGDLYWNSNHESGTKNLTITGNDINKDASFQCKFETELISITAEI